MIDKMEHLRAKKRCGWWCRQRIKWLGAQLPPTPFAPVVEGPLTPAEVVTDAQIDAGLAPGTVAGYFNGWGYF
jgi:hypothetical protein